MAKFCGNCGTPIEAGKPFCISCGAPTGESAAPQAANVNDSEATVYIENNAAPAPAPQQQYQAPQQSYDPAPQQDYAPAPQQQYQAPQQSYNPAPQQDYAPQNAYAPAKKKKTGLIIGITVAVVAIAAIIVYFAFFAGSSKDDLLGKWVCEEEGVAYEFLDNGTMNTYIIGYGQPIPCDYSVKGDTITLTSNGSDMKMKFKLKGDTLTLTMDGESIELVKEKSSSPASGGSASGGTSSDLLGIWVNEDEGVAYEFLSGGTMNMYMLGYGESMPCSYSVDGNVITLEAQGTIEIEYSISGNTLYLTAEGETIEMVKTDSLDNYGESNMDNAVEVSPYDDYDYGY